MLQKRGCVLGLPLCGLGIGGCGLGLGLGLGCCGLVNITGNIMSGFVMMCTKKRSSCVFLLYLTSYILLKYLLLV